MSDNSISRIPNATEAMPGPETESRLGRWYWVRSEDWEGKPYTWLGCCTHEGSNYIQISGIKDQYTRIHLDEFDEHLTHEPDPDGVIARKVEHYRHRSASLIQQVNDIVSALGIQPKALSHLTGSTSLTVPAGAKEVKAYGTALALAENETLPALFGKIKKANKKMAQWMAAPTLPMKAQLDIAMSTVKHIKQRIYAIELYAGVTEEIEQIAEGTAAPADAKVHLFQRRLYMDEECLADYRSGGMDFNGIDKFEAWLLKPANRDRIMPAPKCVVSMRVRRVDKERQNTTILSMFINIKLEEMDTATFLYIRNGENVYRLATELDFSESLFPDRATFDPMRPMMAKMFASRIDDLMDKAEYDDRVVAEAERKRKSKKWLRDNPKSTWNHKEKGMREFADPYRSMGGFDHDRYEPFNPSSVYYDDISEIVAERISHYNRVALIIQGLFDRSPCFQPHLMTKTWRPEDFMRAVDLIYDNSEVLHHGDAPDFEAYRTEINATLGTGSITIGQERFWMKAEAVKYNAQADRSYRGRVNHISLHQPHGNPGPGFTATVEVWNAKTRSATFRWLRERIGQRYYRSDPQQLPSAIAVPAAKLFNVSAYTPGDFKRFYADSRTRAQYLRWAPFLLGAEDWHAAQRKKAK